MGIGESEKEHKVKHDVMRLRYFTRMIADQDVYGNKVKVFAKEILKGHIDSTSTYSDGSGSIGSESRPIIIKKID